MEHPNANEIVKALREWDADGLAKRCRDAADLIEALMVARDMFPCGLCANRNSVIMPRADGKSTRVEWSESHPVGPERTASDVEPWIIAEAARYGVTEEQFERWVHMVREGLKEMEEVHSEQGA